MTTVNPGVPASLPDAANLDHLKKQARKLLQAFRAGDGEARQTVNRLHPRPEIFAHLRDAQLVIARVYGCQDWQHLSQAVAMQKLRAATLKEQAELFVTLGCLRYNGDDRVRRYAQAAALLIEVPALVHVNIYCALVAGNLAAARQHLDKDPGLAVTRGGPLDWPLLMYLTYSRVRSSQDEVLAIAQLLIALGADPDSHVLFDGIYHFSALTGAMGEGERGPVDCPPHPYAGVLVDALLDAGANPNEFQGLYNTMFTDGLDRWLPRLIEHGLNASHKTNDNKTGAETSFDFILCQAAAAGRIQRVEILLKNGANPNAVSRYNGRSCHTNAVLAHQPHCAAILLQHGATVEKLAIADEFRVACWHKQLEQAASLLKQYPYLTHDPQVFSDIAAVDVALIPWLLAHGFAINSQTRDGRTLLHRVAMANKLDTVKAVIALGANPNLTERHYHGTALGFALHNRAWAVVHYLKDITDNIFDMCRIADTERVAELLQRDSRSARQRTPMANTPLHVVSQAMDDELDVDASATVIRLLLAHGADPNAKNNKGATPLEWFQQQGMDELAQELREILGS